VEQGKKEENRFGVETHVASVNLHAYFQHKQSQRAGLTHSQFSTLNETNRTCKERKKRKRENISNEHSSSQSSISLQEEDQFHSCHNSTESFNSEDERMLKRHQKSLKKDSNNQKTKKHK
jgi:hypothetical protein